MSTRQRFEISICFQDKGGQKRYKNDIGTLWFDGQRGTIELPPGVALVGGQANVYINVDLPREQRQGGAQQPRGRGQQAAPASGFGANYGAPDHDDDQDIPF